MKKNAPKPFPWEELMNFAFDELKLPPDVFWSMTPKEIATVIKVRKKGKSVVPISRGHLDALMKKFPDSRSEQP